MKTGRESTFSTLLVASFDLGGSSGEFGDSGVLWDRLEGSVGVKADVSTRTSTKQHDTKPNLKVVAGSSNSTGCFPVLTLWITGRKAQFRLLTSPFFFERFVGRRRRQGRDEDRWYVVGGRSREAGVGCSVLFFSLLHELRE